MEERRKQKFEELEQTKQGLKSGTSKLAAAQKEVTRLTAQEKTVLSQFTSLMADNAKFEKVLTKIYKKKVVRSKKRGEDGDSDSNSDSEDSEDMSDDGDEDDMSSDGEEIDETVCPPGCDHAAYTKVPGSICAFSFHRV